MTMPYNTILERLEAIEADLQERQQGFEDAARDFHKLTRDFELRMARGSLTARADTATEKKWRALDAIAVSDDGFYEKLKNAEGNYEGYKAAVRVLEQRASIGQSLLKQAAQERGG